MRLLKMGTSYLSYCVVWLAALFSLLMTTSSALSQPDNRFAVNFALHPDNSLMAKAYSDRSIEIVNLQTNQSVLEISGPELGFVSTDHTLLMISDITFSPSGDKLGVSFGGTFGVGLIWIVNTVTGVVEHEMESNAYAGDIDWSPNSEMLVGMSAHAYGYAQQKNSVVMWNTVSGNRVTEYELNQSNAASVDWGSNNDNIVVTDGNTIVVLSSVDLLLLNSVRIVSEPYLTSVKFSPNDEMIAVTGSDSITVLEANTFTEISNFLKSQTTQIISPLVEWSPNSQYIASTSGEIIDIWNLDNDELVGQINVDVSMTNLVWEVSGRIRYGADDNQYLLDNFVSLTETPGMSP